MDAVTDLDRTILDHHGSAVNGIFRVQIGLDGNAKDGSGFGVDFQMAVVTALMTVLFQLHILIAAGDIVDGAAGRLAAVVNPILGNSPGQQ